ncbi:Uncharacterised protein [Fusobacterium necrogenes]|uniref:FMN-binding domain n=1 Tax=Fusobacterium necrogenes TaxID=858 RepID=A0A377GX41_9FUSO|nr:hypothetical protein [Fusobacterium necrogenes]STO31529.1 Uncharacterised protein [Fusobacterium necrogenes]
MKKIILFSLLCTSVIFANEYRNGLYRGAFVSGQETQVEVQFHLKNDIISKTRFRTLFYKGQDYLKEKTLENEKDRYQAALTSTEGKNIEDALESLYFPGNIPRAGASLRSSKIRAAMQNALNSGVYKPENKN